MVSRQFCTQGVDDGKVAVALTTSPVGAVVHEAEVDVAGSMSCGDAGGDQGTAMVAWMARW